MGLEVQVLRVFTREGAGGNHLGVVMGTAGITGPAMQDAARTLGFSETVFVDLAGDRAFARIFTPGAELPFAGHPLVGAAWWLGRLGRAVGVIDCGVGPVTVGSDDAGAWIEPPFDQPVEPGTLDVSGWAVPERTWDVLMPVRYHLLRFAGPREVEALAVPRPPITEVLAWAWGPGPGQVTARFFAPGVGVPEDPATGSAAVALAAALRHSGVDDGDLTVLQGDQVGSPSEIRLSWGDGRVRVAGGVTAGGVLRL